MSGKHVIAAALMLGTLTGHSRSPVPAAMPRELVGHEAAQPRLQPGGPIERPGAEPTLAEILGGPGNTREANTLVRAAERGRASSTYPTSASWARSRADQAFLQAYQPMSSDVATAMA